MAGRLVAAAVVLVASIALIVTIGMDRPEAETATTRGSGVPGAGSVAPEQGLPAPVDRPHASDDVQLDSWSRQVAKATGVPVRAVRAYGLAEMWMRSEAPGCHLAWSTLAGVAMVESRHGTSGTSGTSAIDATGTLTRSVIGPARDGAEGRPRVADTDGGRVDGDLRWDRAVGPMQLLPAVWTEWRARAARDGAEPDPQQVDDAALTAARFLCGTGGDLASPRGWWRAMRAQDQSLGFAGRVYTAAQEYATRSEAAAG